VIQCPTTSRLMLLEIKVLRGLKLLRTHHILIGGAILVERMVILLVNAPTRALAQNSSQQPHQLPLEVPITFLLPPSKTMLEEWLITLLRRKLRKLQTLSLVCFSSMPLLQLCCLIPEHHILSYLLHILKSIICPYPCLSDK
jgi:hypothetical protein